MARLYLLLFAVQIALAVAALISCLSADESEINAIPRLWWILIILFFPLVGSIAWFVVGRTGAQPRTGTGRVGGDTGRAGRSFQERRRPRPMAPDDDPDFLRSLKPKPEERDEDQPKG